MSKRKSAAAIAKWAEQQTTPVPHTPAYRRLTDTDRILINRLHAQGLTQVEIAQRLGCDQSSVSRWLAACQDSSKEAIAYLRGQSLYMARKIRNKGKASDLIAAMKGVNVLEEQATQGFSVTINGVLLAGMGAGTAHAPGEALQPYVDAELLSPLVSTDTHSLTVDNTGAKGNINALISPTSSSHE